MSDFNTNARFEEYMTNFIDEAKSYNTFLKQGREYTMHLRCEELKKAYSEKCWNNIPKYITQICELVLMESHNSIAKRLGISETDSKTRRMEFVKVAIPLKLMANDFSSTLY